MRHESKIRRTARDDAREAFDQLPNTEPERGDQRDPRFPDAFHDASRSSLADALGRDPSDEQMQVYVSTWEERYSELMVEAGDVRNIEAAYNRISA